MNRVLEVWLYMQYYLPTDAASSDASNGEGVPYGNFGHDVVDEAFDTSDSEEVVSTPLCAMCHQTIGLQCERCSMWTCELCGIEGGHESCVTRSHLWQSHPPLTWEDIHGWASMPVEVGDRSMTVSTEPPDPARSLRDSMYSYGGLPEWRCI